MPSWALALPVLRSNGTYMVYDDMVHEGGTALKGVTLSCT